MMTPERHTWCLWLWAGISLSLLGPACSDNGLGVIVPSGEVCLQVGHTLKLTCLLYHANETHNSQDLAFYTAYAKRVPDDLVTRLNDSAIQMTIERAKEMVGLYTCRLGNTGVAVVDVLVGHAPRPVTDFRCIDNNWSKMNCTFNFERNPIPTNYTLTYRKAHSPEYSYTLNLNTTQRGDEWFVLTEYSPFSKFYNFSLNITNMFGDHIQNFPLVNTLASVRVDPPKNLTVVKDVHSVTLYWYVSYRLFTYPGNLNFELSYMSHFDTPRWHTLRFESAPNNTRLGCKHALSNFTANAWYDVKIRMKVDHAKREELWSEYTAIGFRTESKIPERPPDTDIGAFWVNELNDVVIYWRQLQPYEENADNFSYVISKLLVGGKSSSLNPYISRVMAKLTNEKDEKLEFEVRSSNALGKSKQSSYIRVPSRRDRVAPPIELKKNKHGLTYTLSWKAPKINAQDVKSYTVFWCKSKSELPNQCEDSIDFKQVGAHEREFPLNTTDGINFAVAANTWNSSSGMVWALCTAGESNDIGKLSTIWTPKITATTMEIQWNVECVDRPIVRKYNLTYCPITSPKDVTCKEGTKEKNVTLPNTVQQYTITGLKPYTTYRTVIKMISDTRTGPPSVPLVNTTYEATPSEPLNLVVKEVQNTTVLLEWMAPENLNGVLSYYEISYNEHKKEVYDDFRGKTNLTFLLENLASYTNYSIVVLACSNCCGCSGPSNSRTFQTKVGAPGAPDTQQVNEGPLERVWLKWTPPVVRAGKLDYYEVSIHTSGDNRTIMTRFGGNECYIDVKTPTDASHSQAEQRWTVRVRAVNVILSGHGPSDNQTKSQSYNDWEEDVTTMRSSNLLKRHSSLGSDLPQAQSLENGDDKKTEKHYIPQSQTVNDSKSKHVLSCHKNDTAVDWLDRYPFYQELKGPWSKSYIHVTSTASIVWPSMVACFVILAMFVATIIYAYKRCFKLKKGSVVLPPGLTDIAEKPHQDSGKGTGGLGGGGGGIGGHGTDLIITPDSIGNHAHISMDSEQLYDVRSSDALAAKENTFDDRQTGCSDNSSHSDSNSLHEQEQHLLGNRKGAMTSASSVDHEAVSLSGEEEEEIERTGLPTSTNFQQEMLPVKNKPQQQIEISAGGYVMRSDGYTQLGELKKKPLQMVPPTEGITGYVTHKELAEFGQRMQ